MVVLMSLHLYPLSVPPNTKHMTIYSTVVKIIGLETDVSLNPGSNTKLSGLGRLISVSLSSLTYEMRIIVVMKRASSFIVLISVISHVGHSSKGFLFINSLYLHNNPMRQVLLLLLLKDF